MLAETIPTPPPLPDFYKNPPSKAPEQEHQYNGHTVEDVKIITRIVQGWMKKARTEENKLRDEYKSHFSNCSDEEKSALNKEFQKFLKVISVEKQVLNITRSMFEAPPFVDPETNRFNEVAVVQQVVVRGMYCNQVIRKMAKYMIIRAAYIGRKDPSMQDRIGLINRSEQFLLSKLPHKIFLHPPHVMEAKYRWFCDQLREMWEKVPKMKLS